jgi:organic hydroperoxide reductase OsmC/OhrA
MTYDQKEPKGYLFLYEAKLFMDTDDQVFIQDCVDETHQRCPISKILNPHYLKIKGYSIKK